MSDLDAIRADVKRWESPLHNAFVPGETAVAHVTTLLARVAALEAELRNIATADWRRWDDGLNTPDDFVRWAKSRARALLAEAKEGAPPQERRVADEPWRIPARIGVTRESVGEIAWDWARLPDLVFIGPDTWRCLMGRRRSDWEVPRDNG